MAETENIFTLTDEEGNEVSVRVRKYFKVNMAAANEFASLINWDWYFVEEGGDTSNGEVELSYNNLIANGSIASGINDLIGIVYEAGLTDEAKAEMLEKGFVEVPEEDWRYYAGLEGTGDNGTGYVRGKDGKPISAPAYVPTKEEKLALVLRNLKGETTYSLARETGICASQICKWTKQYLENGEQALVNKRKPGNPLAKYHNKKELTPTEQLEYKIALLERELLKKDGEIVRLKKSIELERGDARRK